MLSTLLVFLASQQKAPAQVFDWTNSLSGVWSDGINWLGNVAPAAGGDTNVILRFMNAGFPDTTAYNATHDAGILTTQPFVLNGLVFEFTAANQTNTLNQSGGGSLRFAANDLIGPSIIFTNTAGTVNQRASISQNIELADTLTITGSVNTNAARVILNNVVSGAGGLIIDGFTANNGNGVQINGNNSFAGGTLITNGSAVLLTGSGASTGFGTGKVTLGGGYVRIAVNTLATTIANDFDVVGLTNSLDSRRASGSTLGHVRTFTGQIALKAGVLSLSVANNNVFQIDNLVLDGDATWNGGPTNFINSLSSTLSTHTLEITNNNTHLTAANPGFTANINLRDELYLDAAGALGSGTLDINGTGNAFVNDAGALGGATVNVNSGGAISLNVTGLGTNSFNWNADSTLNLNVAGAIATSLEANDRVVNLNADGAVTAGNSVSSANGARVDVTSLTDVTGLTFGVGTNAAFRFDNPQALLLTRGGNLLADAGAILSESTFGAVSNLTGLGTDADLIRGIGANMGDYEVTIGTGTPWQGLANDRTSRTITNGIITMTSAINLRTIGGNLTFGDSNQPISFIASVPGERHDVFIEPGVGGGNVDIASDAGTLDFSGISNIIVLSGATFRPSRDFSLGGDGANTNLGAIIRNGGVMDIGGTQAINAPLLVEEGGRLVINEANNLSGTGPISMEAGAILDVANANAFNTQSPGTQPGTIVRVRANNIVGLDANTDDASVYEINGANRTLAETLTIDGGAIVSQVNNNRSFNATNGSGIVVGPNGLTLAGLGASGVIQVDPALIDAAGRTITIGTTNTILGETGNNRVEFGGATATSGLTAGMVDVTVGEFRLTGGGANYTVGSTIIRSNALMRVDTSTLVGSEVNIEEGATLEVRNNTPYTSIKGNGNILIGGSTAANVTMRVRPTTNTTFNGTIADRTATNAGILLKEFSGTLNLTGANTYSGGTVVNNGTLFVNNSSGSGTGTGFVDVTNNGTLGGSGSISGAVTVFDGATLAPGTSPGTLTVGSLSLSNLAVLSYELDTPNVVGGGVNDLTVVNGDLTLDGSIDILGLSNFGEGTYRLFDYTGSLFDNGLAIGNLTGTANDPLLGFAIDTGTANQVNLVVTAVPEPGTIGLAVLGFIGLFVGIARRRC